MIFYALGAFHCQQLFTVNPIIMQQATALDYFKKRRKRKIHLYQSPTSVSFLLVIVVTCIYMHAQSHILLAHGINSLLNAEKRIMSFADIKCLLHKICHSIDTKT